MSMRLEDMNPDFVKANWKTLEAEGIEVPEYMKPMDPDHFEKKAIKLEKDLQAQVEGWLRIHGYYKRIPSDIALIEKPRRGWQVHVHEAQKNPIMLDILLLRNDGHFKEFELKVAPIKFSSEEQRILCEQYGKPVLVSLEGVKALVERWELLVR